MRNVSIKLYKEAARRNQIRASKPLKIDIVLRIAVVNNGLLVRVNDVINHWNLQNDIIKLNNEGLLCKVRFS